jgi:hypothetical protein
MEESTDVYFVIVQIYVNSKLYLIKILISEIKYIIAAIRKV